MAVTCAGTDSLSCRDSAVCGSRKINSDKALLIQELVGVSQRTKAIPTMAAIPINTQIKIDFCVEVVLTVAVTETELASLDISAMREVISTQAFVRGPGEPGGSAPVVSNRVFKPFGAHSTVDCQWYDSRLRLKETRDRSLCATMDLRIQHPDHDHGTEIRNSVLT